MLNICLRFRVSPSSSTPALTVVLCRGFAAASTSSNPPEERKNAAALRRYLQPAIDAYEKYTPAAAQRAIATVQEGVPQFRTDLIMFVRTLRKLYPNVVRGSLARSDAALAALGVDELQNFYLMQQDVERLATIVVLVVLPFTVVLLALAAIFAPRYLLTRHFWTAAQRRAFWSLCIANRLTAHGRVALAEMDNVAARICLSEHVKSMSYARVREYARVNAQPWPTQGVSAFRYHLYRYTQCGLLELLRERPVFDNVAVRVLRTLDAKMKVEDVQAMDERQLETHLYMRSLRFDHLNAEQMRAHLCAWLQFAQSMPCDQTWLLAPILLQLSDTMRNN